MKCIVTTQEVLVDTLGHGGGVEISHALNPKTRTIVHPGLHWKIWSVMQEVSAAKATPHRVTGSSPWGLLDAVEVVSQIVKRGTESLMRFQHNLGEKRPIG